MAVWTTIPGLTPYNAMLEVMEQKVQEVIKEPSAETIYLLEHEEVYTAGSGYKEQQPIHSVPITHTGRGGKLTYHGKGQRIIYPILNLTRPNRTKDVGLYVRNLERWIINTLAELGVHAYTIKDKIGIWVTVSCTKVGHQHAKIASIGIRIKKWVTYHGIAINISTDLSKFNAIIPCGIENISLTSLAELAVNTSLEEFDKILKQQFDKIFA